MIQTLSTHTFLNSALEASSAYQHNQTDLEALVALPMSLELLFDTVKSDPPGVPGSGVDPIKGSTLG